MNLKNEKAFIATDVVLSIVAILIFSGLIFGLMYNNLLQSIKAKREALATIYLTQVLENVGIEEYNNVTQIKIDNNEVNLIPNEVGLDNYTVSIQVQNTQEIFNDDNAKEDIIKKVTATISYKIVDKEYSYSMQRMKGKK